MGINRRELLRTGLLGTATLGLQGLVARNTLAAVHLQRDAANQDSGYGTLKRIPSKNTGDELLALPQGFQYTVFGKTGELMSDGYKTPPDHDGMAAFAVNGKVRLVRNHESRKHGTSIAPAGQSYDKTATAGTTTLEVDPQTRELQKSFISLSGTMVNCAGGPTPWGTWLTCEETTVGTVVGKVYHQEENRANFDKNHGYVFEVPVLSDEPVEARPILSMGRFVHEAVAVDPSTGIVYQTEDTGTAGFYRFIPNVPAKLQEGGRLQMARIKGKPEFDTRRGQKPLTTYEVDWVEIREPDPSNATEKPEALFEQGKALGGATFGRLEGCWYGSGNIYINSTDGGDAKLGQVWRYRPKGEDLGELTLLFESPSIEVMEAPDNLCVSPRGGLVICEDGGGENYLRGLTEDGRVFDFALNTLNSSEFAGACYSPDGRTLFVNIQNPGLTLAIWGPWERGIL
jgi:hypothetical protein